MLHFSIFTSSPRSYAQFRILVGGTGRNVPPLFRSVPGFSNDPTNDQEPVR